MSALLLLRLFIYDHGLNNIQITPLTSPPTPSPNSRRGETLTTVKGGVRFCTLLNPRSLAVFPQRRSPSNTNTTSIDIISVLSRLLAPILLFLFGDFSFECLTIASTFYSRVFPESISPLQHKHNFNRYI